MEGGGFIGGTMIRPEMFAVECKRSTPKRDDREIFDFRRFLARIESRHPPLFVRLLCSAKNVNRSIDKCVSADLCADFNRPPDFPGVIDLMDLAFVPLAPIIMLAAE